MFPVQKMKNIMILINLMIECDEHLFFSLKPIGVTKAGQLLTEGQFPYLEILVNNSKLPTLENISLRKSTSL